MFWTQKKKVRPWHMGLFDVTYLEDQRDRGLDPWGMGGSNGI